MLRRIFRILLVTGCAGWINPAIPALAGTISASTPQVQEPTVTKSEADILHQVSQLSEKDIKKALAFLLPKIKADASPALDFALGNLYLQLAQYTEAEKAYHKALCKMPGFARARANLARLHLQTGKTDLALQELRHLLLEGSQEPSVYTLTGYTYLLQDRSVPAESAYRQALLMNPDDINAYLGLAKALLMQERFSEAAKILEDVLWQDPERKELWSLLANAHLALDQSLRAMAVLESARRMDAASQEALATLGDLYSNQDQHQEAVAAYQEAFASETLPAERLLRAIEGFLLAGAIKPAKPLLEQVRKLKSKKTFSSKNHAHLQRLEARYACLQGDFKTALGLYQALLKTRPLDGQALLSLGELYAATHEWQQAILTFERAARLPGVKVEALIRHAQVEVKRENYSTAIELLLRAQALNPREHIARYIKQLRYLER